MFKDRLKEARKAASLTQERLAEQIGVKKSTVAGYESGHSEPDMEKLVRIMKVLGVDANYLCQDEMLSGESAHEVQLSQESLAVARAYETMSAYGRAIINCVIEQEKPKPATKKIPIIETIHDSDLYARYHARQEVQELEKERTNS